MKRRVAIAFTAVAIAAAGAGIYLSYRQTSAAPFARLAAPKTLPDLRFVDATGRTLSLADFRGKVVLLNIWATWCAPCRVEMPSLERLHKKLAGTDFRIVAVSVDGDPFHLEDSQAPPGIMAFANGLGLTFDILHDPSGAVRAAYQTYAVPESFVIDREGIIVKKVIGAAEWDGPVTETLIERLTHGQ